MKLVQTIRLAVAGLTLGAETRPPNYLDFIRAEPLRRVEPRAVRFAH